MNIHAVSQEQHSYLYLKKSIVVVVVFFPPNIHFRFSFVAFQYSCPCFALYIYIYLQEENSHCHTRPSNIIYLSVMPQWAGQPFEFFARNSNSNICLKNILSEYQLLFIDISLQLVNSLISHYMLLIDGGFRIVATNMDTVCNLLFQNRIFSHRHFFYTHLYVCVYKFDADS